MLHTLERALPAVAKRPGLLQPYEVMDLLSCRRNWRVTAGELSDYLSRPLDQVLHVVSYMTSMGLLHTCRVNGAWYYSLANAAIAS